MSRNAPATTAIVTGTSPAPRTNSDAASSHSLARAGMGQARRDKITRRIISLPGDLLRHEMMRPRGDTSDEFLAEIVDEVFLPLVSPAY
jgi:hypothetical protein